MSKVTTLAPHDPMPAGPKPAVVVLHRFQEDDPGKTSVEIVLTGPARQTTHPREPDGTPMTLDAAIAAARKVADAEGIDEVFVLDRVQGPREQDILQHKGDHSVHMDELQDTDEEDGVAGSDMRDIVHRNG